VVECGVARYANRKYSSFVPIRMRYIHIMRETCVKGPMESFYMAVTPGVIASRTGPLNPQYPTRFIEK